MINVCNAKETIKNDDDDELYEQVVILNYMKRKCQDISQNIYNKLWVMLIL